jgi:hypothetical protein
MDVNKIKILESIGNKEIVVPISINPDFLDRESAIIQEEQNIIEQIIGTPTNYELSRYPRARNTAGDTSLTYVFNFTEDVTVPAETSYLSKFTDSQVRFFTDAFRNSFFKLDFYDSLDPKTQKNYLTIILPTRMSNTLEENGCEEYEFVFDTVSDPLYPNELRYTDCCGLEVTVVGNGAVGGNPATVVRFCTKIGTPVYFIRRRTNAEGVVTETELVVNLNQSTLNYLIFFLGNCRCESGLLGASSSRPLSIPIIATDFNRNQEGFFLHWFEDRSLLNIDNLYMSAKFFDASVGQYIKFIVNDQTSYTNTYRIPNQDFYYRVGIDYVNDEYSVFLTSNGSFVDTLNWYEYKNPPITL